MTALALNPSNSVIAVLKKFSDETRVNAAQLSNPLLAAHPEYGGQSAQSLGEIAATPQERDAKDWLQEIQSLIDVSAMMEASGGKLTPILHGRLFLICLALLEPELKTQFDSAGFFDVLCGELQEPLDSFLSPKGHALFRQNDTGMADSVPNRADKAAEKIEDDKLGRATFARYLAERIKAVPADESYSIHLYGPWGSGKSSVLNFLRTHLEKSNWVVTEFNAWRNQHINPPWWSLMESVYQQSRQHLSTLNRLKEYWWRFNTGKAHYIIGLLIVLWIAVFSFLHYAPTDEDAEFSSLVDWVKNISTLATTIITLWGLIAAANSSFLFGSAKAAKSYVEQTVDPMESIKIRFTKLSRRLKPKRLVVFIDDLDRCRSDYVIELLEGIQTLFKSAPVVFVVAADRQWLNACFSNIYSEFEAHVQEPGKPLGTLFLEKAFQLASPIPGIPEAMRENYWRWLIEVKSQSDEDASAAQTQAQQYMAGAASDEEIYAKVQQSKDRTFAEQMAIREQAVIKLASNKIIERTEHTLTSYHALLDPNPRSMKRLVNAYSLNRALTTLADTEIELHQLVLWTVLSLQWPALAEYFENSPARLDDVLAGNFINIADEFVQLCMLDRVQSVLQGGVNGNPLTQETVLTCAMLRI